MIVHVFVRSCVRTWCVCAYERVCLCACVGARVYVRACVRAGMYVRTREFPYIYLDYIKH